MSQQEIAKGLKARAAAQGRGGGGAMSSPGPTNFAAGQNYGQGAGVMSQYNEWNFGVSYGTALDRPWADFLSGAFGPLSPIPPLGIDSPQTESGRPEPRRFQYPVGWNMPMGQPGSEGLKLVSFANLRMYADMYSVVRACIQVRKEEILGLDWDIVPTDEAARNMRGDAGAHQDFQDRRRKALKFFSRPDPNYHDFSGWLSAVLEDVFVVDALSLYLHPSRVSGKGLFGSDLAAIEVLDGTTIRPLLDVRGGTPRPPAPAYQQYLWGVPRTDLMDIILEADIEEMDEPVDEYRADQLLYLPYNRRSWTPYGFPGIERAIIPVMTGLRRQQYQLEYFSEGTIPGQFIIPGDDISTPQQIRQLQDTLNAIAGDTAWKHKIIVLPRGSDAKPQKPVELAGQIDEILLNMICMAYDVMPMELGMSPSVSASQSSGAASQMAKASQEINQRKALKPMLQWLKGSIFDHILQDVCHQDDMQFVWIGLEDAHDEETQANNFKTLISTGLLSIDEARAQMGLNPWGLPLTSDPVYASATGISTLGTIAPDIADAELGDPIADPAQAANQPNAPQQVQLGGQQGAPTPGAGGTASPAPAVAAGTPGVGGRPQGGGGGAPAVVAPAANTATPLHGSKKPAAAKPSAKIFKAMDKAVAGELESLRRALKRGKSIDKWTAEFIGDDIIAVVRKSISQGDNYNVAIAKAKTAFKVNRRVDARQQALDGISHHVRREIHGLARQINDPQVGMIGFIDRATRVLQHGYHATLQAGARDASAHHDKVSPFTPHDFMHIAAKRAETQRGYLTGMAQDVKGGISTGKLNQRIALYSRTLVPAYEQGFGLAVLSGQAYGNSTNPADNAFADTTSQFGADATQEADAMGALDDYEALDSLYADDSEIDATSADTSDGADAGYSGFDMLDALVGAALIGGLADVIGGDLFGDGGDSGDGFLSAPRNKIIWHATSEEPCELCADRDGEEYTIDELPCWPGDGGFGEFCDGAANCNCVLEYSDDPADEADNPFKDMANDFYQQRLAEENGFDAAATAARAADIAAVAETSPDAAARMEARDTMYGVPGTRYGPGGRYAVSASATPSVTKSESSKLQHVVWHYLKQHYKKKVIGWVKDADWTFDPKVNVSDLILMRPAADTSQSHVAAIKQEISEGKSINPIVLVRTSEGLKVADGNHRATALKQLGVPTVAAYIATGVGDYGPWDVQMQDDGLKKFAKSHEFDTTNGIENEVVLYKSIDASALASLQVGDLIYDDETITFNSTRPAAGPYVSVRDLPTGRVMPGEALRIVEIEGDEVSVVLE